MSHILVDIDTPRDLTTDAPPRKVNNSLAWLEGKNMADVLRVPADASLPTMDTLALARALLSAPREAAQTCSFTVSTKSRSGYLAMIGKRAVDHFDTVAARWVGKPVEAALESYRAAAKAPATQELAELVQLIGKPVPHTKYMTSPESIRSVMARNRENAPFTVKGDEQGVLHALMDIGHVGMSFKSLVTLGVLMVAENSPDPYDLFAFGVLCSAATMLRPSKRPLKIHSKREGLPMPRCTSCKKNKAAAQLKPPPRGGSRLVCDSCFTAMQKRLSKAVFAPETLNPPTLNPPTLNPPTLPAAEETSPMTNPNLALMQNRKKVRDALDVSYPNIGKGYVRGASDATTAKSLGLSESFVAAIRESDYGPQFVDSVDALRKEGKALLDMAASLETSVLRQLEDMAKRVDALNERIAALEA